MKGIVTNILKDTLENENFRKVLYTGQHCQLVVMHLQPGENIGMEVHDTVDQFIRIEKGTAKVIMDGDEAQVVDDFAFIIPAGTQHDVINLSQTEPLKLYTVYSPANHPAGTIHKDKAEAEAAEHGN